MRVPHPRVWRVGILVWHAERIETLLRSGPTAFSYVQLLPTAAAAGNGARTEPLRERTQQSSAGVGIPPGRVRGDAESCTPAYQRTEEGHAVDGIADAQAASVAQNAEG